MKHTSTVRDLFDSERQKGDLVSSYKDWELPLSDGTKLTGCVSNYIVVRRLGCAYFELFLNVDEVDRCVELIHLILREFLRDPEFLVPISMRTNQIKIRHNEQDIHVKYNQLPIMKSYTIYATPRIELSMKERLVREWSERGIELTLIDQNYVDANERKLRPYAFISHASENKDSIVRPLAERLRSEVGTIWYDEYSLQVGDSLRESIEEGLKKSDRCILILSQEYLKNEGWAKREFDSIYT